MGRRRRPPYRFRRLLAWALGEGPPTHEANVSWVCEEFGVGPREALRLLGYNPRRMAWNLLPLIGECRRFLECHREYDAIMSPSVEAKEGKRRLDDLERHPFYKAHQTALVAHIEAQ